MESGKKLGMAFLSLCILTGCAAETAVEEPPAVAEVQPVVDPPKEEKKEKPKEETFGLTKKETEAMKMVLSAEPYDYSLEDVSSIEKRGEDDTFVNYKVELKSGETLLPSINKVLLEGE